MRLARVDDAEQIIDIYRPYCTNTTITFESEVPTIEQMQSRIKAITSFYPFIVKEDAGQVIAYAYGTNHRSRDGYQWSCESSVYVHENHQRKGLGKELYRTLFELLTEQGIVNVYAGIALPNPKSIDFHKTFGFEQIGTYKNVGYKFNSWIDVSWWHKGLNSPELNAVKPVSIQSVMKYPDLLQSQP